MRGVVARVGYFGLVLFYCEMSDINETSESSFSLVESYP
jgi:hypothetical protein